LYKIMCKYVYIRYYRECPAGYYPSSPSALSGADAVNVQTHVDGCAPCPAGRYSTRTFAQAFDTQNFDHDPLRDPYANLYEAVEGTNGDLVHISPPSPFSAGVYSYILPNTLAPETNTGAGYDAVITKEKSVLAVVERGESLTNAHMLT
jgi:hypothetical protein